jgi:hypothetical protein
MQGDEDNYATASGFRGIRKAEIHDRLHERMVRSATGTRRQRDCIII